MYSTIVFRGDSAVCAARRCATSGERKRVLTDDRLRYHRRRGYGRDCALIQCYWRNLHFLAVSVDSRSVRSHQYLLRIILTSTSPRRDPGCKGKHTDQMHIGSNFNSICPSSPVLGTGLLWSDYSRSINSFKCCALGETGAGCQASCN